MLKVTSSKLNSQKLNRAPEIVEKILKEVKTPIIDKELLVDTTMSIPASQIRASRDIAQATAYLATQAAKVSSEKMAAEKLAKLNEIL